MKTISIIGTFFSGAVIKFVPEKELLEVVKQIILDSGINLDSVKNLAPIYSKVEEKLMHSKGLKTFLDSLLIGCLEESKELITHIFADLIVVSYLSVAYVLLTKEKPEEKDVVEATVLLTPRMGDHYFIYYSKKIFNELNGTTKK